MGFIAGRYTATFNSLALGQTADGYRLSFQAFKRLVTGDMYAESPQDAIFRGMEMFLAYRLVEYDAAGVESVFWPWDSTIWSMGEVGRMDVASSLVKSMVLTAVSGTPAATSPATFTASKTCLAEGFPVELLYAPDLREVPIRQRIYPTSGVFATET